MTGREGRPAALTMPEAVLRDPAEIAINRRGQVSTRQRAALDNVASRAAGSVLVLLAGAAALGAAAWWLAPGNPLIALLPVAAAAVPAAPYLRRLLLFWRAQREARAASVQQATGRVVADGGRCALEAPGVRLHSTALGSLVPGSYRFYYLPQSGWLLSAEALGATAEAAERAAAPAPLDARLAAAFRNAPGDVAANRAGALAPGQARRFTANLAGQIVGSVVLVPASGVALWYAWRALQTVVARADTVSTLCQPGLFAVLAVVAAAYTLREAIRLGADLRGKQVAHFDGVLYKGVARGTRAGLPGYYFANAPVEPEPGEKRRSIFRGKDERVFEVSQDAHDALEPGRAYRVYHLPRTGRVVGVEPIRPEEAEPAAPAPGNRPLRRLRRP